jgi:phosphoserine phosphatase
MTAFLDSVLSLHPRIAAFDCDGTLWSGDVGEDFFEWELQENLVSGEIARSMRARFTDYKAGNVEQEAMCGEMATMHRGLAESTVLQAATRFFDQFYPAKIFPEMRELVSRLQAGGCEVWAVSSSNAWLIQAGMRHFEIPNHRILAASVEIENGIVTDRLIRTPSGPGKTKALREVAGKDPDAAFGNSRWDADMLAASRHPFAINPNPDLEATARQHGWTIYFPAMPK